MDGGHEISRWGLRAPRTAPGMRSTKLHLLLECGTWSQPNCGSTENAGALTAAARMLEWCDFGGPACITQKESWITIPEASAPDTLSTINVGARVGR